MRLAALKTGTGVPDGDFSGSVRSVFQNACLLDASGQVVTIVPAAAGGLPGGINVDSPAGFDFEKAVAVGAAASARAGVLRIAGSGFSVDLRPAVAWRSGLAGLDLDLSREPVLAAWQFAGEALAADGRHTALRTIARPAIEELAAATRRFDAAAAGEALVPLVGLGAGGTPAGDDFLVGYLAALWSSPISRQAGFTRDLARRVGTVSARTNDVSRVYIEAAAEGEVSERLADLAAAIARGARRSAVLAVARAAIAVGHTSGADGTYGLLTGVAAGAGESAAASRI